MSFLDGVRLSRSVPTAPRLQRLRLEAARADFVPAALIRAYLVALKIWALGYWGTRCEGSEPSARAGGAARTHPEVRRSFDHCRNRHRRRNGSAATPGSTCSSRRAPPVSNDPRTGRAVHVRANRRSQQCVPMGRAHHDDRRYRALCFDPRACEEYLAHTNWDDGIQSCAGGAQEEVLGRSRAGPRPPRSPAAAERELARPCRQESIAGHRGVAGC